MLRSFCFLIIVSFLGIGSCKKKDPSFCGTSWALQIQFKSTVMMNAYYAYLNDPTTANCNSYKTATQEVIDALKPFSECSEWPAQEKTEFENALAADQAALDALSCN